MRIKLNSYNLLLTIRRLVGISLILILGYWLGNFVIKFICYGMYLGVELMDSVFRALMGIWGGIWKKI